MLQNILLCLGFGWIFWISGLSNNMDIRFGTWNVGSLYPAGSLVTISKELSRYKLELVGVQEVRLESGGMN
jgi:hypothetical protein